AAAREAVARRVLRVIVENAEETAYGTATRHEIAARPIDYEKSAVPIGCRWDAVHCESPRQFVVADTIEEDRCSAAAIVKKNEQWQDRYTDRLRAEIGRVAGREFDVLIADQPIKGDRHASEINHECSYVTLCSRIRIRRGE